jgi:hypothetical protein
VIDRHAAGPWLVSLAISGVLVVLIEINKHHYAAHRLGGRIGGGILLWVGLAATFRFIGYVIERPRRRQAAQDDSSGRNP